MIPVGVACSCLVVSYLCVYATGRVGRCMSGREFMYIMIVFGKKVRNSKLGKVKGGKEGMLFDNVTVRRAR